VEKVGSMDYDYLSSIVSNYTNLPSLTNRTWGVLNTFGTQNAENTLNSLDSLSSLNSQRAYSSIQDAVTLLKQNSSFSSILESAVKAAGIDEDTAENLMNIASVNTDNAFESEARSDLIMQNYLYAALIEESLKNQVSENADFTSGLLQGLALGDNTSSQNAAAAMQKIAIADTLSAQPNIEAFV